MKQIILLEEQEVRLLQKGKTLVLNTGAGDVHLQFAPNTNGNTNGSTTSTFKCDICGAKATATGRAFTEFGLMRHKAKKHGKGAR